MSKAMLCDNCGETLPLNRRGDDEFGEIAAWITIEVSNDLTWDVCTRACAHELLDRSQIAEAIDDWHAQVAAVAHAIRNPEADDDDESEADR